VRFARSRRKVVMNEKLLFAFEALPTTTFRIGSACNWVIVDWNCNIPIFYFMYCGDGCDGGVGKLRRWKLYDKVRTRMR